MKRVLWVLIAVALLSGVVAFLYFTEHPLLWQVVDELPVQWAEALPIKRPTPEPTEAPTAPPTHQPTVAPTVPRTPVPLDQLYDISVFPPSCTANGYSVYVNRETGAIIVRDEVSRLKHDFVYDPKTGENVCRMCGKVEDPDDALNH